MGDQISAFVAEHLDSWQRRLGALVNNPASLSLHHRGINHLVFLVNEEWVLRMPSPTRQFLSEDNPSAVEIAARMRLFAATHHCPLPKYVFSSADLPPAGGLLIPYVKGRKLELPTDLPLVADCLAALHTTQPGTVRPDIARTINQRMAFLSQAPIGEDSRVLIGSLWERTKNQLEQIVGLAREDAILADSQPGNFIVDSDNRTVVVDVEGDFVHSAGVDLAHITLFSSLLWWGEMAKPLEKRDIVSFYQSYINKANVSSSCAELLALRPLVLCRTLSWMFYFLTLAAGGVLAAPPSLIARASSILRRDNLEILMDNEAELL